MDISRNGFLKGLAGVGLASSFLGAVTPALAEAQQASGVTPKQARIAGMEAFPFTMQPKQVIRISLGTLTAENVLVRLRTEDGLVGWGESCPLFRGHRRHAGDQLGSSENHGGNCEG